MFARGDGHRGRIEVAVATLRFQYFLEDISRSAPRYILIEDDEPVGLLQGADDTGLQIKWDKRLYVNEFHGYTEGLQQLDSGLCDAHAGSIRDQGEVLALVEYFRDAQGDGEFPDIGRHRLLEAVSVEAFDDEGGIVGVQHGVVHTGGLGHIAGGQHIHAAQGTEDHTDGRAGMPDALQAVAARADDSGGLLLAIASVAQRREVVVEGFQSVDEVVYVLDFRDGPEAAHSHANSFTDDGVFPDAGIEDAVGAVFSLEAGEALVDIADMAHIFAKSYEARIPFEGFVKKRIEDFKAVFWNGIAVIDNWYSGYPQRGMGGTAVQVGVVILLSFRFGRLDPLT